MCELEPTHAGVLWSESNAGFGLWCCHALGRLGGHRHVVLLVTGLLFASLPFRVGIGYGQSSLFILGCFFLSVISTSPWYRGLFGALALAKYSFAGAWAGQALRRSPSALVYCGGFLSLFVGLGAWWISSGDT